MDNLWFPPLVNVVTINVHGVYDDVPTVNGNSKCIDIVARDHNGVFLWEVMGPLKAVEGIESQFWAIHLAMKLDFLKRIHSSYIEFDNVVAFDLIVDQDADELEQEGLLLAAQQINLLYAQYNKHGENGVQQKSCKIYSVFSTRNRAPSYLAEYGFNSCSSLVWVTAPFGDLLEILDLDMGLGPHWDAYHA